MEQLAFFEVEEFEVVADETGRIVTKELVLDNVLFKVGEKIRISQVNSTFSVQGVIESLYTMKKRNGKNQKGVSIQTELYECYSIQGEKLFKYEHI